MSMATPAPASNARALLVADLEAAHDRVDGRVRVPKRRQRLIAVAEHERSRGLLPAWVVSGSFTAARIISTRASLADAVRSEERDAVALPNELLAGL